MKEEPFFLVNEFLENEKKELENIVNRLESKNFKHEERAIFLKNFTNEIFKAYKNKRTRFVKENEEDKKKLEILKLKKQKELLLLQLKQLESLDNLKEEEKVKKDLILSKLTNKALVTSSFTGTNYKINEPELNEIKKDCKEIIDDKEKLNDLIKENAKNNKINFNEEYFDKIRYYLIRDIKKFGKISPLLEDKNIKEITCNGPDMSININYQDKKDIPTNIILDSDNEINEIVIKFAELADQKINTENPFLNFRFNNLEIQATINNKFLKPKFIIVKK